MARRPRRAPALALLAVAALCLHVQAMSPIYQAMSTMYNSELSRGLQLGEGSEACCEHLEHVACICDDHEEGTPDIITIDLPETATTHHCDSDNLPRQHHEDTETHVCVTEDYAEEHVDAVSEDQHDEPKYDVEISPPPEESHTPAPSPSDPSQPSSQTVVVVQCNQQSDSSSAEEIVICNNDEVTVVSGDKLSTDIVVIQESTKLSEGDTIIVESPSKEPQVEESNDVTIFESNSISLSSVSSSSSSSSESVSSDSCESHTISSSESSSSSEEEKSHQRHCKRVPSCKCGKCMLRRKLQQQQKEKKQRKQKKRTQRHHHEPKHVQKQKRRQKEKRHS